MKVEADIKPPHVSPGWIGAWHVVTLESIFSFLQSNPFLHCPKPGSHWISLSLPIHLLSSQLPEVHLLPYYSSINGSSWHIYIGPLWPNKKTIKERKIYAFIIFLKIYTYYLFK